MILATDVHYHGNAWACAAGIAFQDWTDAAPTAKFTKRIAPVAPYQPGAFYKRELPCLRALLACLPQVPQTIVIDGFVTLGRTETPGLGAHLFALYKGRIPVIGVAKSAFHDTPAQYALTRGHSKVPLYVTAAGISADTARSHIAAMHGPHRIPTLLAAADRLSRSMA